MNHSPTHAFDIALATKYGIEEAIIIQHFQFWIRHNQRLKRNFIDGKTWTYQTLEEIAAHFPYLSKSKVFDVVEKLCTGKSRKSKKEALDFAPVLMKGNFNQMGYDRTSWYAFVEEPTPITFVDDLPGNTPHFGKFQNEGITPHIGKSQNGDWEIPTPIPDTIPDTKTSKLFCAPSPLVSASPAVPERWEKIEKVDCKGQKFSLRVDDLYTECVQRRADWTREEIEECWRIFVNYSSPIGNWASFVQGTIEKIRLKKSLKNMKEAGEKCQKKYKNSKNTKEKSENSNSITSEPGMSVRLFPNWKSPRSMQTT